MLGYRVLPSWAVRRTCALPSVTRSFGVWTHGKAGHALVPVSMSDHEWLQVLLRGVFPIFNFLLEKLHLVSSREPRSKIVGRGGELDSIWKESDDGSQEVEDVLSAEVGVAAVEVRLAFWVEMCHTEVS